jgi:hypothetical protein
VVIGVAGHFDDAARGIVAAPAGQLVEVDARVWTPPLHHPYMEEVVSE